MLFMDLPLVVRLALLGILVIGTVIATTRGLQYGLFLVLITGVFGMQGMLIMGGRLPNLTMDRVVLPLVLLVFLLKWKKGEINTQPPDMVEYAMLILLIVILTSMYVHQTFLTERVVGEKLQMGRFLTGFVLPFTCYAIVRRGIFTPIQIQSFFVGISFFSLYLAITSLSQALNIDILVYPKYILDPALGIHFGKARGIFLNASHNGLAMAMTLPVLLFLFFKEKAEYRWIWLIGAATVGIAILPTFQRSAWLGAVGALGVMITAWSKQRILLIGGLILASAILIVTIPDRYMNRMEERIGTQETIDFRVILIEASLTMIRDHPIGGVGFNRFSQETSNYMPQSWEINSHNLPLTLFAELGLLGFTPYFVIYCSLLLRSVSFIWSCPQYRSLIVMVWAITAAYGANLIAGDVSVIAYPNILFFALWAMIFSMISCQTAVNRFLGKRARYFSYNTQKNIHSFV